MMKKDKKLGIIVQRYGLDINGGAEYHARLIAQKMAKYFEVEVFTSSAHDYITWEHYYTEEIELIDNIQVNRFKVTSPRDPLRFGKIQEKIFEDEHCLDDEIQWIDEQGPLFPDLLNSLEKRYDEFDYFIFFSYRYYHSYHGVLRFKDKAILVPTAEHDPVIYLRLFKDFFHWPGAIIYNSHEEKEMIHNISGNEDVLGDIVGVGSEIPESYHPDRFRQKFGIKSKYFVYIGRLDENKGVPELLRFYLRFLAETDLDLTLVLMGKSVIPIPNHQRIIYTGFMQDEDKFDALAGAEFLVIPSQFESLSMVTLEAWAIEKPVLANGRTEVLRGQCKRSNGGLWYTNFDEFKEALLLLHSNDELRKKMGANGKLYFNTHYSWGVIEKKYLDIIDRLENQQKHYNG